MAETLPDPREVFVDRVPWHAFATDDVRKGLRMYPGSEALQKALLQFNAKHSVSWLVYDCDSPTAVLDWEDANAPPPNIIARNPENGHAHVFYGLETPVHRYASASPKAQRFLSSVDVALTAKLQADPGFSKLIAKNPVHVRWDTHVFRLSLYDMAELSDWLDLSRYSDARKRLPAVGLGRNCTLFENLRRWAYRARREQWLAESFFSEAVLGQALFINRGFQPPLPHSEVRATARSVSRWVWARMSPLGFVRSQQVRGKKGGAVRRRQAQELARVIAQAIRQNPGLSQEDIAALCGVSRWTVYRHTRGHVAKAISDKGSSGQA